MIMNKLKRFKKPVRPLCAAFTVDFELLESRRLLSAAYMAVNLSRLVPASAQNGLQAIQITKNRSVYRQKNCYVSFNIS